MGELTQVNGTAQIESKSYFDGGLLQFLGWSILGGFVTLLTLGICAPFAMCWLYSWEAKHTVLDGRRLEFTGTAGGLFGTWIVCLFLTIITVGIYSLWIPIRIRKWREANTFFEDEIQTYDAEQKLRDEKASYFDGSFLQWLGWSILGCLVTIITLGFCYPWAVQMIYSWEQRHKVYCKHRCTFDGRAAGLFGTWTVCLVLTIITLGIYSLWISLRVQRWKVSHTHLLSSETL